MKRQKGNVKEEKEEEDQEEVGSDDEGDDGEGVEGSDDDDLDAEDMLEMEAVFGLRKLGDSEGSGPEKESRTFINNRTRMLEKLAEIKLGKSQGFDELPWDTLQVITSSTSLQEVLEGKEEDDFERESAIVRQGLEAAEIGYAKLKELGIPYIRPDDYFAEMVKTDDHMDRVRKRLLAEKTKVEGLEERRRLRQMKKYGKEIQREKQKERDQHKKSALDAAKRWRKDGKPGDMDDEAFLKSLEKDQRKGGQGSQKGSAKKNAEPSNRKRKRDLKDEKYGFGGRKKRAKKNTADSASSMGGFSLNRNRSVPKDLINKVPKKMAQKRGGSAGAKRPGKRRRQQSKK